MAKLKHLFLCVAFLLVLSACAAPSDEMKQFEFSILRYEKALRWQDYDLVISFHKNEHKTLTEEKRKYLKQFRVTGYNIVYTKMEPDQQHATQVVEIKYYNTDYQVVREITLRNDWEFDEKVKQWYLMNPLPDFK